MTLTEDDRYDKYCAICKAKGGPFWTHDTEDCKTLAGFRKKKQRVTHNQEGVSCLSEHSVRGSLKEKIRITGLRMPKIPIIVPVIVVE